MQFENNFALRIVIASNPVIEANTFRLEPLYRPTKTGVSIDFDEIDDDASRRRRQTENNPRSPPAARHS